MAEFWDLSPIETVQAIEAYAWRDERAQRFNLKLAWDVAMLSRQKRIPPLKSLLGAKKTKVLKGPELQKARADFSAMASKSNLDLINTHMRKKVQK